MKGDIDRKRMFELAALRPKSYSILFYFILKSYYFIDDKNENKKAKKKKTTLRFINIEDHKHCLEAIQTECKINHLEKHKVNIESLDNRLILKSQQRFRSEKHNAFTEEIKNIALSAKDDRRIQSIDSIKTYAYVTSKYLVYKQEEIRYSNISKQYKND